MPRFCSIKPVGICRAASSCRRTSLSSLCRRSVPNSIRVENIWQFLRDNWISNRIFASYENLLDHCCSAWNKLIDMPWKITWVLISGSWYKVSTVTYSRFPGHTKAYLANRQYSFVQNACRSRHIDLGD
jgi:hypothetical protein